MNISDMEARTGITKKNIRYYEQEGLISPKRNKINRYRQYDDEDVQTILNIKLLRKLNISIEDIRLMQQGSLPLEECTRQHLNWIEERMKQMRGYKKICDMILLSGDQYETMQTEKYLKKIADTENTEKTFFGTAKEFVSKLRWLAPPKASYTIEPEEGVVTAQDMAAELTRFADENRFSLSFLRPGFEPVILLNGCKYYAMYIRYAFRYSFGYGRIKLYKADDFA